MKPTPAQLIAKLARFGRAAQRMRDQSTGVKRHQYAGQVAAYVVALATVEAWSEAVNNAGWRVK